MSEQPDEITLDDLPPHDADFDPCEDEGPAFAGLGLIGSTHKPLTWLEDYFKKWGVPYRVVSGWETRGRATGRFNPRGVLNHHTGSTSSASNPNPSIRTLVEGRSDLAGPLCHVSTGYDGVTTIIAAGRANHAGTAKAADGVPAGDGNELWVGNEIATNGTQKMPQVQYDAVVLVNAAILDGLNATAVALHHTTSTSGKWDFGAGDGRFGVPYDVRKLRADVAATLAAGPTTAPTGGFMSELTAKEQRDVYNRIMGGIPAGSAIGRKQPDGKPARVLDTADGDYLRRLILAATLDVPALAAAVAAAIPAGSATQETIEAALRSVLGSLGGVEVQS